MQRKHPKDKVHSFIINKIKQKVWLPSSKIMTENQLSAELNVSRVAVREAIENLVGLGILTKKRGAGTFVNNIDSTVYMNSLKQILFLTNSEVIYILDYRIYFEYANMRMFMNNCTEDDICQLEHYFSEMKKNINNSEEFGLADFNFHHVIINGTKNPIVIKISYILFNILKELQPILYKKIGPKIGMEYHESILKAIKSGDAKIAALYMKKHIETTKEAYINLKNIKDSNYLT